MRKVKRSNSLVSRRARELKRESKATVKSGLGLVPKLGTALGIYDTARGVSRTTRAAIRYGDAVKQQTVKRFQRKVNNTTRPIRNGLNSINKLLK